MRNTLFEGHKAQGLEEIETEMKEKYEEIND